MLQKLKRRILVHCEWLIKELFFYAFAKVWNMQGCPDKPFCTAFMFLHVQSRFILHKNLFSAVCEAFSLMQIKVSFVFILLDRTELPCLCSALVCEWRNNNIIIINHIVDYSRDVLNHYWQPGKISFDNKSLQIQAKSCDFILNPAV